MDSVPTGVSLVLFLAYAGAMLLFHVYFAYGLQLVADEQEQGEAARVLAWIPGLQLYTYVRCGGGSFVTLLVLFPGGMVLLFALGAFQVLAGGGPLLVLAPLLWSFALFAYVLALNWRMAERQGLSGAVSLLLLLPLLNLVAWWLIAYRNGLGPVKILGAALGIPFLLLSVAPAGLTFGTMGSTVLAASAAARSGSPEEAAGLLEELRQTLEAHEGFSPPGAAARSRPEVPDPDEPFGPEFGPESGRCPPGTAQHGARPPRGFELWCAREGSDGRERHGWAVTWHPNGVRATRGSYRDGLQSGTWTRWDDGGMKRVEAQFEHGEQNGLMRRFDLFGELEREVYYRDGEPVDGPS